MCRDSVCMKHGAAPVCHAGSRGELTLIASCMWSCRITSAERSMYHFRQRISSLKHNDTTEETQQESHMYLRG